MFRKDLTPKQRSFAPAATVIFLVAFTLRFIHIWQIRNSPFFTVLLGDARGYDEWAQRIARGDWLGHGVFYQAPLYPYFLGAIYRVAGRNLMLIRIVQAAFGSSSCVLVALAARRMFSARVGLVAGFMLAIYAPAIFFDGLLQKSVLDLFFVSLVLWLVARIISSPPQLRRGGATGSGLARRGLPASSLPSSSEEGSSCWRWLMLGLAFGGLSVTRENALVLIAIVFVWTTLRFGMRPAAIFAVGVAVVLLPVVVRNSIAGGGVYLTTAQFGPNFFIGNHSGASGTYQSLRYGRGSPEYEQQDATDLAQQAAGHSLTPGEVSSFWTQRALAFIASDPGAWLKLMARKIALLGNATEMVDTEDQTTYAEWSTVLTLLGPLTHFGVLVPVALVGLLATWSTRTSLVIFYALLAAYAGSVVLFYVVARYRYPLVPMLILFAAAGVVAVAQAFARASFSDVRRGWRTLGMQAAAVVAAAILVNWPIGSASAMRAVTDTNLGAALQTEHRLDGAILQYRRAIAVQPDYAPAYNNLGTALREEKRIDEAAENYEQALKLQPEFATAHYNFANLLLEKGDTASASDHFKLAMQKEPASADVHNNFAIALASAGRIEEAVHEFRRAVDLDPTSAKAYRNLGDTLSSQGRWPEAISALRRAVGLDSNDADVRYDLASALLESGSFDEAIPEFRVTLQLAPKMAAAHNNLGIALGSQGKLDEAIEEFRRALAIEPGFADAQRNLTLALTARSGH